MRYGLSIIGLVAVAALVGADVPVSAGNGALSEGASRKDVVAALGAPTLRRGTIRNDHGQLVEVWEYWDGDSWEPIPTDGVPNTFVGNEARYTIQDPLAVGTWYRRVRAGVVGIGNPGFDSGFDSGFDID